MRALLFACALAFAAPAAAQTLDANNDGQVTRAEIEAATLARFAASDANQDGLLRAEELTSFPNPAQLLYIVDADQDGALGAEEWQSYASFAASLAFMLCDADKNDALTGAEVSCSSN